MHLSLDIAIAFHFSEIFDMHCNHYLTLILLIPIPNPVTLSHTLINEINQTRVTRGDW